MNGDPELELFTEALRADLPSSSDEARLRLRLTSAGVLAGAGVVAPTVTAAATSTAATSVATKFLALPLAMKIGASIALAGAAAVPLVRSRSHAPERPVPRVIAPARAPLLARTTNETRMGAPALVGAVPEPRAPERSSSVPEESSGLGTPAAVDGELGARPKSRGPRPLPPARAVENTPPVATQAPSLPAEAAFAAPATMLEDEGTLRAETALMERALAALKQGDFAGARHELALHASQFPNGHLAPERERALARIREKETTR